jgi:hypothetical protein
MSGVPTWLGRHHHTSSESFLSRFLQKRLPHSNLRDLVPFNTAGTCVLIGTQTQDKIIPVTSALATMLKGTLPRVRLAPVAETRAVIRAAHQSSRQLQETPTYFPVRPAGNPEREDLGNPPAKPWALVRVPIRAVRPQDSGPFLDDMDISPKILTYMQSGVTVLGNCSRQQSEHGDDRGIPRWWPSLGNQTSAFRGSRRKVAFEGFC